MPRYYFNVYDGSDNFIDHIGEELPDRYAAWHEATTSAGLTLRDLDGKLLPGSEWRMEVVDEQGNKLFKLHVSAEEMNPPPSR